MMRSREVLLRLLHDPRYSLAGAEVWYTDRGAPGNMSRAAGRDIVSLGPFAFQVSTGTGTKDIPYHRIIRVIHGGEVLWEHGMKREGK